jgi:ectoine hydroxylase-related dioxygenase (phytanoyl-CoA dioxygenase family)
MNLSSLKQEYQEKGIIVIPNVFTPTECKSIKEAAYTVTDKQIKDAGYPHSPSEQAYNKKSLIFFPALANQTINQIRISHSMSDLVREFIGDDVRQINNQIYFREKGDLDEFAWHQDTIFREPSIFTDDVEEDYFQTIIAVDDITEDNGAIEFIEGSHKTMRIPKPQNLRKFERGELKGKKYTATQGSVLIWSVMIVHGSEKNNSNADRMTYMNGFCRTKAARTYPHYMINGQVVPNIDPRMIP